MIYVKRNEEIEKMREASRIVAEARELAGKLIRAGIRTIEIDSKVEELIRSRNAVPSFKGYHGFPAATCISVNQQVVHGIPGELVLQEGDVVGIDVGAFKNGYHGDGARTFAVGEISPEARLLLEVTEAALREGIQAAVAGSRIGAIGHAVQGCAQKHGYGIVRDLVGHGIGRNLHEEPQVPNYGRPDQGPRIRPGMVLAIEPMLNAGTFEVETLKDGWTIVTKDGRLSAHFEETVAVTDNGPEVLTRL
jgi:methionyl aminopeptidase